jgi:hypothetical protein
VFTKLVRNGIVGAIQSICVSAGIETVSLSSFASILYLLVYILGNKNNRKEMPPTLSYQLRIRPRYVRKRVTFNFHLLFINFRLLDSYLNMTYELSQVAVPVGTSMPSIYSTLELEG